MHLVLKKQGKDKREQYYKNYFWGEGNGVIPNTIQNP
jgi:hypothetical protein